MKIRNGFVSNSSSSSFIVIWDKKPESIDEIKNILFDDKKSIYYNSEEYSTNLLSTRIFDDTYESSKEEIYDFNSNLYEFSAYDGFKWYNKGYKSDETLLVEFEESYSKATIGLNDCYTIVEKYSEQDKIRITRTLKLKNILDKEISINDKEYITALKNIKKFKFILYGNERKHVKDSTNKFMKDFEGKFISIYEYSDHHTLESCLENFGVFDKLPHFIINNH